MGPGIDLRFAKKYITKSSQERRKAFLSLVISTKEVKVDFKEVHEVPKSVAKRNIKT